MNTTMYITIVSWHVWCTQKATHDMEDEYSFIEGTDKRPNKTM